MFYFEKKKKKKSNLTPYLESSFFWKLQVGRNTILTPSHMFGSENQNFLYYHGVANNLGMPDLLCWWLFGQIRRIWNCTDDGLADFGNLYNLGSKKVKVVGWAWEGFWSMGVLFLIMFSAFPANNNWDFDFFNIF